MQIRVVPKYHWFSGKTRYVVQWRSNYMSFFWKSHFSHPSVAVAAEEARKLKQAQP